MRSFFILPTVTFILPIATIGFCLSLNVLAHPVQASPEQIDESQRAVYTFAETLTPFQTIETKIGTVTLYNQPEQGNLVYGHIDTNARLYINEIKITPFPTGDFIFALPTDAKQDTDLTLKKWLRSRQIPLNVQSVQWPEEEVTGLPPATVQLSEQNKKRVAQENELVRYMRQQASLKPLPADLFLTGQGDEEVEQAHNTPVFPACFNRPVTPNARLSSTFGSRRVLNGVKKRSHSGTDYALPRGNAVYAVQDGVVLLAHPDLFYSGKTILIDHGYGFVSGYSHLNQLDVQTGDTVRRGQMIGTIGTTGRSTGPHLHFVLSWHGIRVDSERVFQQNHCPIFE